MANDIFVFEEGVPTPDEHYTLRKDAGLTPPPRPDNEVSLKNTWYGITARVKGSGEAVGMGRIVGDGAIFLVVVDMAVSPTFQRRGIGQQIMERLVAHADKHAPNAYLSLFSDPPGIKLYLRHGFKHDTRETPMLRSEWFGKELPGPTPEQLQ